MKRQELISTLNSHLGAIFSCLDPILSIAVSLNFKDPFQLHVGKERQAHGRKKVLARKQKSDHMLLVNAFHDFEQLKGQKARSFCQRNFMSYRTLLLLVDMKKQIAKYIYSLGFIPKSKYKYKYCNRNSTNTSLVKAVVCAGLYPNVLHQK